MIDLLLWIALGLLLVLVVAAMVVPLTVLIWWAGWSRRAESPVSNAPAVPATQQPPSPGPFLVYLSGVGDISDEYQTSYEDDLLAEVAARVPGLVVTSDVFAFSVDNLGMTSQRSLGWFWAWINKERLRKGSLLRPVGHLIDLRNILQLTVSADARYGPIYNYSVAEIILQSLMRHGYVPGSGAPVALLGYSGGGQIALATAEYVKATLQAPVQVISMGGLMNSSRSLQTIERLTHLYGTHDYAQRVADWVFPKRWPIYKQSDWNRAIAEGRLERICLGPMGHTGRKSYLDGTVKVGDGRSYRDVTADAIAELVRVSGERRQAQEGEAV
jgi:hypothetical protein